MAQEARHARAGTGGRRRSSLSVWSRPDQTVRVPAGTLLEDAISQAGLRVPLPCGGQGRCGRCVVEVREGAVQPPVDAAAERRRRSAAATRSPAKRWSPATPRSGCRPSEKARALEDGDQAEKAAPEVVLCEHHRRPWVARYSVDVDPPSMEDNTPDLERLQRELARQHGSAATSAELLTALAKLPLVAARGRMDGHRRGGAAAPTRERAKPSTASGRAAGTRPDVVVRAWPSTSAPPRVATYLADLESKELVDQAVGLQRPDRLRRGRHLAHHLRATTRTPPGVAGPRGLDHQRAR